MIAVRYRTAALVATVLAPAAATLALSAPASADVKGVTLKVTQPATFVAGGPAGTLSVTAATDGKKPGCRKVRWTLEVRVQGLQLNQVRVQRLEGDGDFPVDVQASGDTARIVDRRFDTGSLCSDKTDTAAYAIAITGGHGSIAFRSEPHDAAGRLLSTATSQSAVEGTEAVAPPPAGTASPSPSPSAGPSPSESDAGAIVPAEVPPSAILPAPAVIPAAQVKDRSPSLLGPGLIIGGLLVLLGVGLLFRMRRRSRRDPRGTAGFPPTSFYPTYR
jgi:hypothetical protein